MEYSSYPFDPLSDVYWSVHACSIGLHSSEVSLSPTPLPPPPRWIALSFDAIAYSAAAPPVMLCCLLQAENRPRFRHMMPHRQAGPSSIGGQSPFRRAYYSGICSRVSGGSFYQSRERRKGDCTHGRGRRQTSWPRVGNSGLPSLLLRHGPSLTLSFHPLSLQHR